MNILVLLAKENNLEKSFKNQSMLDICFDKFKSLNQINFFLICIPEEKIEELKYLKNNNVFLFKYFDEKNETIKNAIINFSSQIPINQMDRIVIHDCNFANVEKRIINDILNKSSIYNFINTIYPIEHSFKIVNDNGSQFLVKNKEEIYFLQSPQMYTYNLFIDLYLDGNQKPPIKMMNILGSKYNYDLSDDINLKLFKIENDY